MPRVLWWSQGEEGVSYERGTPVEPNALVQVLGLEPRGKRQVRHIVTFFCY